MSRRVADRWRNPERQGSIHDSAKAAAYRAWAIALASTKDLHEAEFVYTDDIQRIAVIGEYLAFLVHFADRLCSAVFSSDQRASFVSHMAQYCSRHLHRNACEILGSGDHRRRFIDLYNRRSSEYAESPLEGEDPGFGLLRALGANIQQLMGNTQTNRWVIDQVISIDGPQAIDSFRRSFDRLLEPTLARTGGRRVTES